MKRSFIRIAMVAVFLTSLYGVADLANAGDAVSGKVERTLIGQSDILGTDLETRVYLISYPPGASAPLHHHPVVGLGYIVEGSALSAYADEETVTLTAGQSFQDKAQTPHILFSNPNPDKPLRFLVAYTVKKGAPVIEIP